MDKLALDIEFLINNPQIKEAAQKAKDDIAGIDRAAQTTMRKTMASVSQTATAHLGIIERLKIKLEELKQKQSQATSTLSIEKYNVKIQEFQKEINRLNKIGKQGFDDMGRAIPDFERPKGQLARMQQAANLYKTAILQATSPEMLAKYNAKLEQTEAALKRMRNAGRSGFDPAGIAVVQKPTNTLGRLEYAANAYQNMAASSNNIDIVAKYNRKLQETQTEIGKIKNVGKQGFDVLGNKITGSANIAGKLWKSLRMLAMVLPGIGVAGLLAFAVEPLINYLSKIDLFSKKISQAVKDRKEFALTQLQANKDAQRELTDLKLLYQQYQNAKLPLDKRKEAYQELQKLYPGFFANLKFEQEATSKTREAYDRLTGSILATARARAYADKISQNVSRQLDDQFAINESQKELERIDKEIAEAKASRYQGGALGANPLTAGAGDQDTANTAKQERLERERAEQLKKLNDAQTDNLILARRNSELEKQVARQVEAGGKIKGDVGRDKPAHAQKYDLTAYKALQQEVNHINAEYARKSKTKDQQELQALTDKFIKISEKVKAFNKDPKNKYKIDGESLEQTRKTAIEDLKYRQDTQRLKIKLEKDKKLYEEFYEYENIFGQKAAQNKYGQVKQHHELLKNLQEDYNRLSLKGSKGRLTGGQQERLEQYQEDIAAFQQAQAKQYIEAFQAAKTFAQQKIQIEQEYQDKYLTLMREQNGEVSQEQRANLEKGKADAIEDAKHEALIKTEIYKKAAQDVFDLTKEQTKKELNALKKLIAKGAISGEAKKRVENQINKLEFVLKIGVDQAKLQSLEDKLKAKIQELNASDRQGISLINQEDFDRIKKEISEISGQIEKLKNPLSGKAKSSFAQGLSENFEYLKGESEKFAEGISKDLGNISGSFYELSQALGGADTQVGYLLDSIGRLTKVGSEAAGAFASFMSGNIVDGIQKTIGAVVGLFSIGKRTKEMNARARKEVEDFYANAIAGERAYQDLLKERALQTVKDNKTRLNGIGDEIKMRQSQTAEWEKESQQIISRLQGMSFIQDEEYKHGTWFRKAKIIKHYGSLAGKSFGELSGLLAQGKLEGEAKALVERLKDLEQKGFDAKKALHDLQEEARQLFTGTTADALTDSLIQMFKEGKTGVKDMADFFETTMQNAALSIFKNNVLAEAMQTFYNQFSQDYKQGELNKDKIANLKALFNSLMSGANQQFENLKQITGLDLGSSSKDAKSNTIRGNVENITAQQADVLSGNIGGMRQELAVTNQIITTNSSQQLAAIQAQTIYQMQIAANCLRTADNTDKLKAIETALISIDRKMNNNNNAIRAAGG